MSAADIALALRDRGWRPFGMDEGSKFPPPTGVTGYNGRNVDRSELAKIADRSNLALRMTPDVLGIDIDAHDGKPGLATLADLEKRLGPLPPTCHTHSNRGDGSRIRFYRVPPGTHTVTALPGIEFIQWFHRYAVVAPSVHPEGRRYAWFDEQADEPVDLPPEVGDLPELPWAWIKELSTERAGNGSTTVTDAEVRAWFDEHTDARHPAGLKGLAGYLANTAAKDIARHDTLKRGAVMAALEVTAGYYSALDAVGILGDWWDQAFTGTTGRRPDDGEFGRLLIWAIGYAKNNPAEVDDKRAKLGNVDPPAPVVAPMKLDQAHAVARRWLGDEYDLDALNITIIAAAVERLDGDPVWVLVISGSGNAKTESVQALGTSGAIITSTITSVGALLSASPKKEKAVDATGGLLRKIGDHGTIVIKDVTSILSMDRNGRAEVLAALREVYDGRWERNVGTDGGRTLTWQGRIAVIGAVTTAWDRAHDVISAMGDRFVLLRMDSNQGRLAAGRRSIGNTGHEVEMRADLCEAVAGVLAGINTETAEIIDADRETLLMAADIVTRGRTAVDFDYRGDVIDAHAPEMPTRFAKQLAQVVRGGLAIGMTHDESMRLAIRCARDSMPPLRLAILLDVAEHPGATTTQVRKRIGKPRATVDRQLQSLHMLELLECIEDEEYRGNGSSWRYSLAPGIDPGVLTVTRFVSEYAQGHKKEKTETVPSPTHISGDALPTAATTSSRCPVCHQTTDDLFGCVCPKAAA